MNEREPTWYDALKAVVEAFDRVHDLRERDPEGFAVFLARLSLWNDLVESCIRERMEQEPPPTEDELVRMLAAMPEMMTTGPGQLAILARMALARAKKKEADNDA